MSKQDKSFENGFLSDDLMKKIDDALQYIILGPLANLKKFFSFFPNKK